MAYWNLFILAAAFLILQTCFCPNAAEPTDKDHCNTDADCTGDEKCLAPGKCGNNQCQKKCTLPSDSPTSCPSCDNYWPCECHVDPTPCQDSITNIFLKIEGYVLYGLNIDYFPTTDEEVCKQACRNNLACNSCELDLVYVDCYLHTATQLTNPGSFHVKPIYNFFWRICANCTE